MPGLPIAARLLRLARGTKTFPEPPCVRKSSPRRPSTRGAVRFSNNIAHALCATGNHGEAEALAEENLVLQNRVYGTAHPNAAAALELVGHVRAGLAAQA